MNEWMDGMNGRTNDGACGSGEASDDAPGLPTARIRTGYIAPSPMT